VVPSHLEDGVVLRGVIVAAIAVAAWIAYLIYRELGNTRHIWHDPCVTPQDRRRKVLEAIRAFKQVADSKGITWWLDYGTLLGAWRIGRSMPFDHDADLSYLAEHKTLIEESRAELAALGIEVNTDRGIFYYAGQQVGDLEAWYLYDGLRCREDPATRRGLFKIMRILFDDFPTEWVQAPWRIRFEGDWYPCPRNPERLLRRRYPTCRIHLRLCFPHKQRCWFSADFWRDAWRIFRSREGPLIQSGPEPLR
jgi:hypothetical protein